MDTHTINNCVSMWFHSKYPFLKISKWNFCLIMLYTMSLSYTVVFNKAFTNITSILALNFAPLLKFQLIFFFLFHELFLFLGNFKQLLHHVISLIVKIYKNWKNCKRCKRLFLIQHYSFSKLWILAITTGRNSLPIVLI